MASPRAPTEELELMRLRDIDSSSQNAAGDRERHPATTSWYSMFATALKMFMRMMPQSVANVRGMAGANVADDPDLLCDIGISFFKKAEEQKEI